MRARVVIGANWGDEGKGLVTDWLCSQGAGVVVRFNGGAQAGHTVVTPGGMRHVFHHFGSGTFLGIPTFLSQFFLLNPICFFKELDQLAACLPFPPQVYAHPECLVSTFADMIISQELEDQRGRKNARHGSCGLGINETVERSALAHLKITMADLWNFNRSRLEQVLRETCTKYAAFRIGKPLEHADSMIESFLSGCERFAAHVHPAGIGQCKDPVFEGAQGLMLDQDNKEFFPHVTRSKTGMHNVRVLCAQAGITSIEAYYVSRTYLTRHGAGRLPGESSSLKYDDSTNVPHAFQGVMRFAPLDYAALLKRCEKDFGSRDFVIALTHCDQEPPPSNTDIHIRHLFSTGPTRNDVCDGPNSC